MYSPLGFGPCCMARNARPAACVLHTDASHPVVGLRQATGGVRNPAITSIGDNTTPLLGVVAIAGLALEVDPVDRQLRHLPAVHL